MLSCPRRPSDADLPSEEEVCAMLIGETVKKEQVARANLLVPRTGAKNNILI